MDASHQCLRACFGARLLLQSYYYPNLSEGADRVAGQLRGDKEYPFGGVTKLWQNLEEGAGTEAMLGVCIDISYNHSA